MSDCQHSHGNSSVYQTLDELDFERGVWYAAQHGDVERVEKLLRQGTNVDQEDKAGYTALHYAARNGHVQLCRQLLKAGAGVNITTRAGKATALHRCALAGHLEVFQLLMQHGADLCIQDADGKTALHRGVEGNHPAIVEAVLSSAPHLATVPDNRGHTPQELLKGPGPVADILKRLD